MGNRNEKTERALKMKQKTFFIIFKGPLMTQMKQMCSEGESPTLIQVIMYQNCHNSCANQMARLNIGC